MSAFVQNAARGIGWKIEKQNDGKLTTSGLWEV